MPPLALSTPPHPHISPPPVSPLTPPIHRPARKPSAAKKDNPPQTHTAKGSSDGATVKTKTLSAGGFAKMNLFGALGREELKPLRRDAASRGTQRNNGFYNESSDEEDSSIDLSSSEDEVEQNEQNPEQETNDDPNFNADLSDVDLSRSPSPPADVDEAYSLPVADAVHSHPDNVPSADCTLYFEDSVPTGRTILVYKTGTDGSETTPAPAAYWKWATEQEVEVGLEEEMAQKSGRNPIAQASKSTAVSAAGRTSKWLTLKKIPIRIQRRSTPLNINWIQRAADIVAKNKAEEDARQAKRQEMRDIKKRHAEMIKTKREEAMQAVAQGVIIDDEDGFIRVKGTRKRTCAVMDLEVGRVRRKYRWKQGMPPLRGKKKIEYEARVAREKAEKAEARAARRAEGLPVTDTEEEDIAPPTPKLPGRKKASVSKKKTKKSNRRNQDAEDTTDSDSSNEDKYREHVADDESDQSAPIVKKRKLVTAGENLRVRQKSLKQTLFEESASENESDDDDVMVPEVEQDESGFGNTRSKATSRNALNKPPVQNMPTMNLSQASGSHVPSAPPKMTASNIVKMSQSRSIVTTVPSTRALGTTFAKRTGVAKRVLPASIYNAKKRTTASSLSHGDIEKKTKTMPPSITRQESQNTGMASTSPRKPTVSVNIGTKYPRYDPALLESGPGRHSISVHDGENEWSDITSATSAKGKANVSSRAGDLGMLGGGRRGVSTEHSGGRLVSGQVFTSSNGVKGVPHQKERDDVTERGGGRRRGGF